MADEKNTKPTKAVEPEVKTNADSVTPPTPEVRVPAGALVGDEAIAKASTNDATPVVVSEEVPAQVTGAPSKEVETVKVHEVSVSTDEVITDPNSPLAVQIPDAGRGSLDLPAHALAGKHVEDVFAAADAEAKKNS